MKNVIDAIFTVILIMGLVSYMIYAMWLPMDKKKSNNNNKSKSNE